MKRKILMVVNAGSSSLKLALYKIPSLTLAMNVSVSNVQEKPSMVVTDHQGHELYQRHDLLKGHEFILNHFLEWFKVYDAEAGIDAVGHRVVHGGNIYSDAALINEEVLNNIKSLAPLAPLHQPHNIHAIELCIKLFPAALQVACFDTVFHQTKRDEEQFALPEKLKEEGILSYGFHGLSYHYIASILPKHVGRRSRGKVIVAHLGNGASVCALYRLESQATTMTFTPLSGLVMGTRCGDLDPAVVLYLMQHKQMSAEAISDILYYESGLKALSGQTHDMQTLTESSDQQAKHAVRVFCYQASKHISSLIPVIGGLDILVFTGGIGEHNAEVRKQICARLSWLGAEVDSQANNNNALNINKYQSKVEILVIPTDESKIISDQTYRMMNKRIANR